jgi:hypothetical protein
MMRPMLTTEWTKQHERELREVVEARRRHRETIEASRHCVAPPDPMPPPARVTLQSPNRSEAA